MGEKYALNKKLFEVKVSNPCLRCKWFESYFHNASHIGWCKRFKNDPDSGYILKSAIPPCATWEYEKERLK